MLIYKKYISKSIVPPFIVMTVILTSLVWVTQALRLIHFIDKGMGFKSFLKIVILIVPSLLFIILPIIAVITVVYTYNHLQDERQIVILRGSGLNNYDLAKPALMFATIITIISYYLSAHLMPVSYNRLKENLSDFKNSYISNIIEVKTFNQISSYASIYVREKNPDGSLEGLILFDNKIPEKRVTLFAKKGRIITSNDQVAEFELTDGFRHAYDENNHLTKLYFDKLIVAVGSNNKDSSTRSRTSIELYIHEMLWPDDSLSAKRQSRLVVDGHIRIIWPLFNFAFVFLSLSIFLTQPYTRKSHVKQFLITFIPLLLIAYIHFSLQNLAYRNHDYIFLCYANVFLCIIFSIWQSTKNSL